MTISQAVTEGARALPGSSDGENRRTARLLLAHVLGLDQATVLVRSEDTLAEAQFGSYLALISRRGRGEPLQYILGHQEFFGFDFVVTPAVLIPRPETEFLVEDVLKLYHKNQDKWSALPTGASGPTIVDVGTGSGCIAVALAKMIPAARVIATDISKEALAIARLNAERNGVEDRIRFLGGDLFAPLRPLGFEGSVDFVVSNPPYVADSDSAILQKEVRDFEPRCALYAGPDGLDVCRRLLSEGRCYLSRGGFLVCELGYGQAAPARRIASEAGWRIMNVTADLQQIPRVLSLQNPTN